MIAKENANKVRMLQGYTITSLAKEVNMHRLTIQQVMNRKQTTTPDTARKISEVLKCEIKDIFEIREGN